MREMACVGARDHVLHSIDLLALVFRSYVATEAIIETLLRWKVVSKDWHAAISCVLVVIKWLRPFCCSAEVFVGQIAGLVSGEHGDKSADTSLARKQANADYYVDMMFLHMYSEHAQYEALSSLDVVVGQIFMQEQTCMRAIAAVNMAMTVHASFQRVQQAACGVIEVLAKNEMNKEALLEAGTLDKMMQAGHRFSPGGDMSGFIVCAVNRMVLLDNDDDDDDDDYGHQASIEAVINAGAIRMVTEWMWAETETHQLFWFKEFCLLINYFVRFHATTLLHAKTDEFILGSLAKFQDIPWLQWRGLHSLTLLVQFGEADAIDFFGVSRGMELVFACMDYPHKVGFVSKTEENGIKLLAAIVRSYPKTTDHMVSAGLIPVLRKTMAQTMSMSRRLVHMNALASILSTLASNVAYRSAVASADIVPTVCLAMQACEDDCMLQTYAITLLGYLNNSSSNTLQSMVPPDVVRLVTQAMLSHEDNIRVQRAGIGGLMCFVASRQNIHTVSTENGVNVLLRAMWKFNTNPYIAKKALLVLNILSVYGDNLVYMQKTGIVHSALISMQNHPEDIEVQTEAISTLFNCVEAHPHMHAGFRQLLGMWMMKRALEMPELDGKCKQMVRKIMEACAD